MVIIVWIKKSIILLILIFCFCSKEHKAIVTQKQNLNGIEFYAKYLKPIDLENPIIDLYFVNSSVDNYILCTYVARDITLFMDIAPVCVQNHILYLGYKERLEENKYILKHNDTLSLSIDLNFYYSFGMLPEKYYELDITYVNQTYEENIGDTVIFKFPTIEIEL